MWYKYVIRPAGRTRLRVVDTKTKSKCSLEFIVVDEELTPFGRIKNRSDNGADNSEQYIFESQFGTKQNL